VLLTPEQYPATPAAELLSEIAKGRAPFDHAMIRALLDRPEETAKAIAAADPESWQFDITDELVSLCRANPNPATLPFLVKLLDESPQEEDFDAIARLGATAVDPLLAAYEKATKEEVREEILFALAALGIEDERIENLLQAAPDGEIPLNLYREGNTPAPYDIYGDYDKVGLPVIDALPLPERIELLDSPVADHRALAAGSLFREELTPAQQDRLLKMAREDSSLEARALAWQSLDGALDRPEFLAAMKARLAEPDCPVEERGGILVALSAKTDEPGIREAIVDLYGDAEGRFKALEAMWRSLDPEFAPFFPAHLDDDDVDLRRVALRGVGVNAMTSELGRVRALLQDEDVREDALFAYALAAPGKDSPAFLRSVLNKIAKEAGGLSEEEDEIVRLALDERLRAAGKPPAFSDR
jgi:hypothetical protein